MCRLRSDLPIGYSLGPQDPRGPPKTVVRMESMAGIRSFRLNFIKNVCLNYYSQNLVSFNFRSDNTRVFQWVSIRVNLNMTVDQAACQLLCRYTHSTLAASCVCWIIPIATRDSIKWTCGCSCVKCIWSMTWLTNRPAPLAKLNVKTGPLAYVACKLVFTILLVLVDCWFLRFSECFLVISVFV